MPKTPHPGQKAVSSSFRSGWRALIALTDERVAERVLRALPPTVETTRVSPRDAMDAAGELANQLIFADLADAEQVLGARPDTLCAPSCPAIFLTTVESLETSWPDLLRQRVPSFLDIELVEDPLIFEAAVSGTLSGLGFDAKSLFEGCGPVDVDGIESEPQRRAAAGRVLGRLQHCDLSPLQLTHSRLVMEEILTNAMRHASSAGQPNAADRRNAGGSRDVHQVTLTSVVTPELFAISVIDPAGSLTAEMVRQAISRQLAGDGDFDSGGRGLFIAYSLSNLVVITVDPGRCTEVAAFFRFALPEAHKALIINPNADTDGSTS
jgi:anti-sigma regulatory factor (Ser/Thr protein kinase)